MSVDSKLALLKKAKDAVASSKAYSRLQLLFDEGSFVEIDGLAKSGEDYTEALAGFGTVEGCPVYAFSQNSDIAGGAMSKAQAAKIRKVYDLAVKTGAPVVGLYDSKGARLQEGNEMLAAYGELLLNCNNLSGVVPQISVVLGPCLGTSALLAVSADLVVMSADGELEIETNGADGSAERAEKSGMAHIVVPTEEEAIAQAKRLITMLPSNNLSVAPVADAEYAPEEQGEDAILSVVDAGSFVELQKNYGASALVGLARMSGDTVGVVAFKGLIDEESCAKAARTVRFCDAFALPVLTFVDSEGFASLKEAAKLTNAYAEATTVKITVITGEAHGPLYTAVAGRGANADVTIAWPQASVSALAPKTAVAFLWGDKLKGSADPVADREKLIAEYKETEASPLAAAAGGFIEDVVAPEDTRAKLFALLDMMAGKRVSRLPKKHANIQL